MAGASDRLRIDIRGDREGFARRLKEAGFDADVSATAIYVSRRDGVETAVFDTAKVLGAEVRYMGKVVRSLEEMFLELVERKAKGDA